MAPLQRPPDLSAFVLGISLPSSSPFASFSLNNLSPGRGEGVPTGAVDPCPSGVTAWTGRQAGPGGHPVGKGLKIYLGTQTTSKNSFGLLMV